MRRTLCLLAALLALPLLGSDAPKEFDGAAEMYDIEGSWLLISQEYDGTKFLEAEGRKGRRKVTYQGGKFARVDDKEVETGTYTTDTHHNPAHLDARFDGSTRTLTYLYRRDGDTLRLGILTNGRGRPTSFSDKHICILTYRRGRE